MGREQILESVKNYYRETCDKKEFSSGERINYAGRVYDEKELCMLVDSALDFWLTSGRYTREFEDKLAEYQEVKYCSFVNSGSSANLLAVVALTSPLLGERRIKKGDEVITAAAAFPTTVAPIIQCGAIPVFVDIELPHYNISVRNLEEAYSEKTKAVFLAHNLGNVFDLKAVKEFCDRHNLWLIEDNCDALGGIYKINGIERKTGSIGDIGTSSFYPAHHITTGEGGAVYTSNPTIHKIVRSMRDWGRECICAAGQDNLCGHRYDGKFGQLPEGYDHKYVYSHLGYNLKATDMQAAIGVAQMDKLPAFVEARRKNWAYMYNGLQDLSHVLILPQCIENAQPSWFGFVISVREDVGIERKQIVEYLESHNIQTRYFFAGNILKHPCFEAYEEEKDYRVIGGLEVTDYVMNNTFWVGLYSGMSVKMLDEMIIRIHEAVR